MNFPRPVLAVFAASLLFVSPSFAQSTDDRIKALEDRVAHLEMRLSVLARAMAANASSHAGVSSAQDSSPLIGTWTNMRGRTEGANFYYPVTYSSLEFLSETQVVISQSDGAFTHEYHVFPNGRLQIKDAPMFRFRINQTARGPILVITDGDNNITPFLKKQ